jgi:hypothetical protein
VVDAQGRQLAENELPAMTRRERALIAGTHMAITQDPLAYSAMPHYLSNIVRRLVRVGFNLDCVPVWPKHSRPDPRYKVIALGFLGGIMSLYLL